MKKQSAQVSHKYVMHQNYMVGYFQVFILNQIYFFFNKER